MIRLTDEAEEYMVDKEESFSEDTAYFTDSLIDAIETENKILDGIINSEVLATRLHLLAECIYYRHDDVEAGMDVEMQEVVDAMFKMVSKIEDN